ncbi:MAG: hypothetical protein J7L38_02320 [Thermoproteales archaeon]|nr:hypothetical protein [Thermoproteales archaeon]
MRLDMIIVALVAVTAVGELLLIYSKVTSMRVEQDYVKAWLQAEKYAYNGTLSDEKYTVKATLFNLTSSVVIFYGRNITPPYDAYTFRFLPNGTLLKIEVKKG